MVNVPDTCRRRRWRRAGRPAPPRGPRARARRRPRPCRRRWGRGESFGSTNFHSGWERGCGEERLHPTWTTVQVARLIPGNGITEIKIVARSL